MTTSLPEGSTRRCEKAFFLKAAAAAEGFNTVKAERRNRAKSVPRSCGRQPLPGPIDAFVT